MNVVSRALIVAGFALGGCASAPGPAGASADELWSIANAMARLNGPPHLSSQSYRLAVFEHDPNADESPELVAVILEDHLFDWMVERGELPADGRLGIDEMRDGLTCSGFMLLEKIDGRWWPAAYYFYEWRIGLSFEEADEGPRLVGNGWGETRHWYWGKLAETDWRPPTWQARSRSWAGEKWRGDGRWRSMSRYVDVFGK